MAGISLERVTFWRKLHNSGALQLYAERTIDVIPPTGEAIWQTCSGLQQSLHCHSS